MSCCALTRTLLKTELKEDHGEKALKYSKNTDTIEQTVQKFKMSLSRPVKSSETLLTMATYFFHMEFSQALNCITVKYCQKNQCRI